MRNEDERVRAPDTKNSSGVSSVTFSFRTRRVLARRTRSRVSRQLSAQLFSINHPRSSVDKAVGIDHKNTHVTSSQIQLAITAQLITKPSWRTELKQALGAKLSNE